MSPAELHIYLGTLPSERHLNEASGLMELDPYRADLEEEIAHVTRVFTITAVSEIATLRAELSGRQYG